MTAFSMLGLVWVHCLKQQNTKDLMSPSVKAVNCSSYPLYHVKEVFVAFFFLLHWGIKAYGKLVISVFTGTPSQYYPVFYFIIFTCIFVFFANFSDPHTPTLVSDNFVEAGLRHAIKMLV